MGLAPLTTGARLAVVRNALRMATQRKCTVLAVLAPSRHLIPRRSTSTIPGAGEWRNWQTRRIQVPVR